MFTVAEFFLKKATLRKSSPKKKQFASLFSCFLLLSVCVQCMFHDSMMVLLLLTLLIDPSALAIVESCCQLHKHQLAGHCILISGGCHSLSYDSSALSVATPLQGASTANNVDLAVHYRNIPTEF